MEVTVSLPGDLYYCGKGACAVFIFSNHTRTDKCPNCGNTGFRLDSTHRAIESVAKKELTDGNRPI